MIRRKLAHGPGIPTEVRERRLGLVDGPYLTVGEIGGQRPCLVDQENRFEAAKRILLTVSAAASASMVLTRKPSASQRATRKAS